MARPFATTVIGSLPKPAWLYERASLSAAATDHHGRGAAWALLVDALQDVVNSQTTALREDLAALRQESEAAKMEISALRDEWPRSEPSSRNAIARCSPRSRP